jgi:hypothetical protein
MNTLIIYGELYSYTYRAWGIIMDKKPPLFNADIKDVLNEIRKARSDKEVMELLKSSSNHPDKQRVMQNLLGGLIEDRFGSEQIRSSEDLNKYLQRIKEKDYPALDKARQLISKDIPNVEATFNRANYGDASFSQDVDNSRKIPIGIGSSGASEISDPYTKSLLSHELGHANDTTVATLKRAMESMPESRRAALQQKIDDLGSDQFSEHFKNTKNKFTTLTAGGLTPDNYEGWREMVRNQEPSPIREQHLNFIDSYEKKLKTGVPGNTFGEVHTSKSFDIPVKDITKIRGEGIHSDPDRSFMTKVLQSEMNPVEAEIARSSDHHLPRLDVPDDTGHYESRNIKRLLTGKGLLGTLPVLGAASQVVPSIVDLKEGNPNTAAARMVTGLAPAGSGELDADLLENAKLRDSSPELFDPSYRKTLEAIGARRSREGRSPVVESISGQQVDTEATEGSDFENLLKKKMNAERQG